MKRLSELAVCEGPLLRPVVLLLALRLLVLVMSPLGWLRRVTRVREEAVREEPAVRSYKGKCDGRSRSWTRRSSGHAVMVIAYPILCDRAKQSCDLLRWLPPAATAMALQSAP